jgi:hypothetical protein
LKRPRPKLLINKNKNKNKNKNSTQAIRWVNMHACMHEMCTQDIPPIA